MRLFFLGMVQFGPDKLIVLNAILHDTSLIVALSLTYATTVPRSFSPVCRSPDINWNAFRGAAMSRSASEW